MLKDRARGFDPTGAVDATLCSSAWPSRATLSSGLIIPLLDGWSLPLIFEKSSRPTKLSGKGRD